MQGIDIIRAERVRQIQTENYTPDKDKGQTWNLVNAAVAYAHGDGDYWPMHWDYDMFKPTTVKRNLVKAGALIAAAIDSLEETDE